MRTVLVMQPLVPLNTNPWPLNPGANPAPLTIVPGKSPAVVSRVSFSPSNQAASPFGGGTHGVGETTVSVAIELVATPDTLLATRLYPPVSDSCAGQTFSVW